MALIRRRFAERNSAMTPVMARGNPGASATAALQTTIPKKSPSTLCETRGAVAFSLAALFSRLTEAVEGSYLIAIAISARAGSSRQS
jgi:hypothetical protein